ncbi:MAG: FecR domain-containing protein [Mediterranea sp.]|jgi:ferric-dicitrate binding protein FerR (iron transport regulator)|nr:FecR domain-containing protein [Mediterranea sp.]
MKKKKAQIIPWNAIIAKLDGDFSAADEQLFAEWIAIEGNSKLFADYTQLWEDARNKTASLVPDTSYYWSELKRKMAAGEQQSAITIRTKRRHRLFRMCAEVAAIGLLFIFIRSMVHTNDMPQPTTVSYTNQQGKSMVVLPDESTVWLHDNSQLSFTDNPASHERIATLSGEAFFEVSHNKKAPFIVVANGLHIKVYGTKFNVNALPGAKEVHVSLQEGSVAVYTADNAKESHLKPGETATYDTDNRSVSVTPTDLDASLWTKEKVVVEQRSLRDVCRILSSWYNVKIEPDATIADVYFYTFTLEHETLDDALQILAYLHPLNYHKENEQHIFIYPGPN